MVTTVKNSEKKLGEILVDNGVITTDQLEQALQEHSKSQKKIGDLLIDLKMATNEQVTEAMGQQHGLPYLRLSEYEIDPEIIESVSEEMARKYRIIPVDRTNNTLTVALADPANVFLLDDIRVRSGMEIVPLISLIEDIDAAIEKYFATDGGLEDVMKDLGEDDEVELLQKEAEDEELGADEDDAPVVKLIVHKFFINDLSNKLQ